MIEGLALGSMVHYVAADGETYAAIVTRVKNVETGTIHLSYFADAAGRVIPVRDSSFGESGAPKTWHWPV